MEITCPTKRPVPSENFSLPSSLSSSCTTYWVAPVLGSCCTPGWALTTSAPSRMTTSAVVPFGVLCISFPPSPYSVVSYSIPSRKVSMAVADSSFMAFSGSKSVSPDFQGKRTIMRLLASSV